MLAALTAMEYQEIYDLSKSFGPPEINLRDAQIIDDYGDDSFARLQIEHKNPEDVSLDEINYYGGVYAFLKPKDLIFYLYPLLVEFKKDMSLDSFDSYMYSMDREIDNLLGCLTNEQVTVLKLAFQVIWKLGGDDWADWSGCPNLCRFIEVTVE